MTQLRLSYLQLLGSAILALAAAIALVALWLRAGLREQSLRREAATLHAITTWQRALEKDRVGALGLPAADQEFALLTLAAARLPDVVVVEAFTLDGTPVTGLAAPLGLAAPTPEEWTALRRLRPAARLLEGETILEITVPLHEPDSDRVTGALRYRLDAAAVRAEFARLDARLLRQALLAWLATGLTLAAALALVFGRLARADAALRARTADLEQANRELTFAAKTSALGAITAHLVHGLRNPVAGLAGLAAPGDTATLHEASAAARRIRQMVEQVTALLREEKSGLAYEVLPGELLESVVRELGDLAQQRRATLALDGATAAVPLDNRRAALCLAILRDLTRNALEAAPSGGRVALQAAAETSQLVFTVTDDGPGVSDAVTAHLFEPHASAKPNGAGIGLAICRQLALHLGAVLEHDRDHRPGARFRLRLPLSP